MDTFWRTFHHDGISQPDLSGVQGPRPPPFDPSTITIHSSYFSSTLFCSVVYKYIFCSSVN